MKKSKRNKLAEALRKGAKDLARVVEKTSQGQSSNRRKQQRKCDGC